MSPANADAAAETAARAAKVVFAPAAPVRRVVVHAARGVPRGVIIAKADPEVLAGGHKADRAEMTGVMIVGVDHGNDLSHASRHRCLNSTAHLFLTKRAWIRSPSRFA